MGDRGNTSKIIVAIGDSLIKGNPTPETGGWVGRVFKHPSIRSLAKLINTASGGDNTRKVIARLEKDCIDYRPDGVILGIGINDSRIRDSLGGVNEVPLTEFEKNLQEIIDRIKIIGINAVLLSIPLPVIDRLSDPFKPDKRYQNRWVQVYVEAARKIGIRNGLELFDRFDEWSKLSEDNLALLLPDGVHPSSTGYDRLVAEAIDIVKQWVANIEHY